MESIEHTARDFMHKPIQNVHVKFQLILLKMLQFEKKKATYHKFNCNSLEVAGFAYPLGKYTKDVLYFSFDMVVIIQSISEYSLVNYADIFNDPNMYNVRQHDINYLLQHSLN
jgi:hypothetical protein